MKLSKKFLNDYINVTDIDYHELAQKMLKVGNEYEKITKLSSAKGLVVGKVLEVKNHEESNHLHICQVDIGSEILQIVCGAKNVEENIKVIVAKIGSILPSMEIKKIKLAGIESNGMICSLAELGIEAKFLKEVDKNGIHILPEEALIGTDAIEYLGYDDEIIDFDLTSNRGDLLSIIGMAYEIGAIYNRKVELPISSFEEFGDDINETYTIDVRTDNCFIYLGKKVLNVTIKESPLFIKNRLMASGIRPINNVVDISNYVMLEYGQPLHFFDADKLGKNIIVRMANNEKITTLDTIERTLSNNDVVIANENVVALAGVMGGFSTEIDSNTKNIFIEAAIFDSYHIRRTSKSILRSEASNRYEKGVNPNFTDLALKRACYLLENYANGKVCKGTLTYDVTNKEDKKIDITLDNINQVLGMNLTINDVVDILKRLEFCGEFKAGIISVNVPKRRMDVNIKEELIEEIGRIYGYDNLKTKLPIGEYKNGQRSFLATYIKEIRNNLIKIGLNQVLTYTLINKLESDLFINESYEKVFIKNPMTEDHKYLRNSLIPSLLNVSEYNITRNIKDVSIFEIGKKFRKESTYIEENVVSGLVSGTNFTNNYLAINVRYDFYLLKGIIENLFNYLGFNNRYSFIVEPLKDMHKGRSAKIYIDKDYVGFIGQIDHKLSKNDIYVFEISIDKIIEKPVKMLKFKEISKYPEVSKDMAFIVDKNITAESLIKTIYKMGSRILASVSIFDVYTGDKIASDKKSIAFTLTFMDSTKTLTDIEVMEVFNRIILEVTNKYQAQLRDK
ncbi:MAG: phenylalanine--tRNA ligase subunit beta [Bacilli bacterium]